MIFKYRVKNSKGEPASGLVEAKSEKDAVLLLRNQGLFVINLAPFSRNSLLAGTSALLRGVSFNDIVNFTRQLSTMITSGLILTEALTILRRQTDKPAMAEIVDEILREIEAGNTLANALEKHSEHFSKIYISLIRAGEAGGMLDKVLERLADNLEKQREFKGKIKGAMIYPVIIVLGMIGVIFVMMTLVVPKLTTMYKEFNVELPLTTKILIFVSDLFVSYWWLILIGTVGLILVFRAWQKTSVGRHLWDSFILNLPVFGNLQKEIILVEFTRTLGMLVGAGLPILEALNIVGKAMDNVVFQDGINEVAKQVEKGFPLGLPLSQNDNFPPILGQMTKVGEETGKLDESLLRVSRYFESESDQLVKGLTTAIEPIIMVILGIGVGFLILSIIMPMYQLTAAF